MRVISWYRHITLHACLARSRLNGTWMATCELLISPLPMRENNCCLMGVRAEVSSGIHSVLQPARALTPHRSSNMMPNCNIMAPPQPNLWHSLQHSFGQLDLGFFLPEVEPTVSVSPSSPIVIPRSVRSRNLGSAMPRSRGVSRRGSSSAPKGRARQSPSPLIIPISFASPSSPPPNPAKPVPNSSFQNSRFTFRSRLNQPIITFTTTIMVSEESELPVDPISSSSTPSPKESLSQGVGDNPNFTAMHMQEDSPIDARVNRNRTPTAEEDEVVACGPVQHDFGILPLINQSEGGAVGDDEASWVADPEIQAAKGSDPQTSGE